jgi:hypothetical protein
MWIPKMLCAKRTLGVGYCGQIGEQFEIDSISSGACMILSSRLFSKNPFEEKWADRTYLLQTTH